MLAIPDILLICVGTLKNRHYTALTETYFSRLNHEARVSLIEIKDRGIQEEGKRIVDFLDKHKGVSFALGEEGTGYTSRSIAKLLKKTAQKTIFIIGGPDGLSTEVKKHANHMFSLSPLTFTHEMARLLMVEQLYRACSILHNRHYHRD